MTPPPVLHRSRHTEVTAVTAADVHSTEPSAAPHPQGPIDWGGRLRIACGAVGAALLYLMGYAVMVPPT